jgi:hypothetical protein
MFSMETVLKKRLWRWMVTYSQMKARQAKHRFMSL